MSVCADVADRKLVGVVVRVGRYRQHGPMFKLARFDKSRQTFTAVSMFTGAEAVLSLADLDKGIAEGIIHIVGRSAKES